MKRTFSILFGFFLFVLFPQVIFAAATITFENGKSSLGSPDEEYTINVTISFDNDATYYLRGVFFKPNTSNYCGFTWNGSSWFKGPFSNPTEEGWKNFLKITLNNGSWSGELKAKIDTSDNGCKDTGEYRFKVQRFIDSTNGSFDAQTEQVVQVTIPTLIPTPTPTPVPATQVPTTAPTNTPVPPTNSPTAVNTPTPLKTPTPVKSPTSVPVKVSQPASQKRALQPLEDPLGNSEETLDTLDSPEVLAAKTGGKLFLYQSPTPEGGIQVLDTTKDSFGSVLVVLGGIFLFVCGILAFYVRKKNSGANI